MPTNLYGPNDNFDLTSSHVLPALIRKFHERKRAARREVEIWGSGRPRREFLHVDDLADACVFLMEHYDGDRPHQRRHRRGSLDPRAGRDGARHRLSRRPSSSSNPGKPDGTPRKLLDVSAPARPGLAASHLASRRGGADLSVVRRRARERQPGPSRDGGTAKAESGLAGEPPSPCARHRRRAYVKRLAKTNAPPKRGVVASAR